MAKQKISKPKVNCKTAIYLRDLSKPIEKWMSLKDFERLHSDYPSQTPRTAKQRPSLASERKEEEADDDEDGEEVVDSDAEPLPDATTLGESANGANLDFATRLQALKKYRDEQGEIYTLDTRQTTHNN